MFRPIKLIVCVVGLAVGAFALPASAQSVQPNKSKKPVSTSATARANTNYRGVDKFRAGPLYYAGEYLGDDPDPFIRLQIQRDLTARFPGND